MPGRHDPRCSCGPVDRSGQVRSGQVRSGQVRSGQVRSGQVRAGQGRLGQGLGATTHAAHVVLSTGQVRSGQVRSGQVRSGPAPRDPRCSCGPVDRSGQVRSLNSRC